MQQPPYAFYFPQSPSPGSPMSSAPLFMPSAATIYEHAFADGLLENLFPVPDREQPDSQTAANTSSTPTQTPARTPAPARRSRTRFQWPSGLSEADRLLVMYRCMERAGFESFGEFFAAALKIHKWKSVHKPFYQSVASFLQCQSIDQRTHPISIVESMFNDPRCKTRHGSGNSDPFRFDLPRYALPPSQRLGKEKPPRPLYTTHDALLNFSLHRMLERWNEEADTLLDPTHGFVRHQRKGQKPTWAELIHFSMTDRQETIATVAPAIFAGMTTIGVSASSKKKLDAVGDDGQERSAEASGEDDEDENENDASATSPATGVPQGLKRDPWLGSTVAILMLLYFRYRFAIIFPTFIGLFLFTCNVHRDVFSFLCRVGLSVQYSTILNILKNLAEDSSAQLVAFGAVCNLAQPMFLLLFDNINKMQRAWRKVLGRSDTMANGTAATLVQLEDVPEGAMNSAPVLENIRSHKRRNLTVEQLVKDINWDHLESVGEAAVLGVWTKHVPSLVRYADNANLLLNHTCAKRPLRLRKSVIHPMRTTNVDESQTTGVASELQNLISDQLQIAGHWLECWLVMICGDQLSIDRIRKIKLYTAKADTPFDRHKWAWPVIQLWHLKWNWLKCIYRLHYYVPTGKSIFGLHHDIDLLQRSKFNPTKCDFYPAHHIIEDRSAALILEALRILCEERSEIVHLERITLLEGLERYFGGSGPLSDISFNELRVLANRAYRRYMCNAAYEDAQGIYPRDPEIHGPIWSPSIALTDSVAAPPASQNNAKSVEEPTEDVQELNDEGAQSESESNTMVEENNGEPPKKKQKTARAAKSKAADVENIFGNDQCFATTVNFLRMSFLYLEMCSAVAAGDIGRVFEVIKVLRFSFWGAGSTNYGNELLELACNFLYEFPPLLVDAILNNYLVNSVGMMGHWLELDLLQEHYNFWIKRLFNSKSHDFDSKHLAEAVSLNIHGFSEMRKSFPGSFGLERNSGSRTAPDVSNDINTLGSHYRADNILRYIPGRNGHVVPNEYNLGRDILASGKLTEFLQRTTDPNKGPEVQPSQTAEEDDTDEDRVPSNPITLTPSGAQNLSQFTVGDM